MLEEDNRMDLLQLFKLQKELDDRIAKEHDLQPKKLLKEKMLALLVEIGELANETRCFKHWSNKGPNEKEVILMEYVDGEDLLAFLKNHPTYFEDAEHFDKFVGQLLSALQYLHDNQVLHLDLKPENIMLTRIGCDVKVVDLGCCYSDTFVDSTGYTTQYAAPEQLAGRKVDVRTDIYAVGKILELLPHHPIYNKVIKRCLDKNPQNRYQTIAELQKALSVRNYNKKKIVAAVSIVVAVSVVLLLALATPFQPLPNEAKETPRNQKLVDSKKRPVPSLQDSMEKVTAEAVVVKNPPLSGSVSEEKEKVKSHNWQKEMDAMLDKAYKKSISSFCDSIFPSPTVGLAWKAKSSEFHNQVMKITSDFHAKYPEVEESLLFAYAENKFQSVVGYVFGRMQENGRKNLP